jgi:hypothetical protein
MSQYLRKAQELLNQPHPNFYFPYLLLFKIETIGCALYDMYVLPVEK